MKTKSTFAALLLGVLALMPLAGHAAGTNLTALLQQGLFEEQANRNLDAAIEDYVALAKQFDKDRQLAATAVFRLGECYRAQGKTNEAAAHYQRILRDFADQTTLASLSRQNLAGMGAGKTETAAAEKQAAPAPASAEVQELERTEKILAQLRGWDLSQLRKLIPTLVPDEDFERLNGMLGPTEMLSMTTTNLQIRERVADLKEQMEKRAQTIIFQLQARADSLRLVVAKQSPAGGQGSGSAQKSPPPAAAPDNEEREIARIEKLVQNSPDLINSEDGRNAAKTPLIQAACVGWLKVAAYLLDHGADVNRSADGVVETGDLQQAGRVSPLFAAVASGNKAMTAFLIERGAEVNFKSSSVETTPLHLAAVKGFQAVVEVLLASHADLNAKNKVGQTPLVYAVQGGQIKIVQMLIAAGANPNLKDGKDNTVLNSAIKTSPEMVKVLLAAKADPNTGNSENRTLLSYAVERDNAEVVKMLLAAKADPNGGYQDAPLLVAVHAKNVATAELLLQAGAKPNAFGSMGDFNNRGLLASINRKQITPLWLAIYENQFPMAQLLLKYKADPNDAQTEQQPVIFKALDKPEILQALLEAGANVEVRDKTEDRAPTPLLKGHPIDLGSKVVGLLLQHGANPNAVDTAGNTPLHLAAEYLELEETFALLLEHKANLNVRNKNGQTPLDFLKSAMTTPSWRFSQNSGVVTAEQKAFAEKIAALLRAHGALDKLPDWDRITVSRPAANFSQPVFQRGTNDWNRFTLLELLYAKYNNRSTELDFADLAHIVVARPSASGAETKRIAVNLLNATNGVDVSRDLALEFGDVVEIPERQHSLSDRSGLLSFEEMDVIQLHFQKRAGEAQLAVAGSKTIPLPLPPYGSLLKRMLSVEAAQAVLTSSSDLSRVKVIRRDAPSGKTREWMVDCAPEKPRGNMGLGGGAVSIAPASSFEQRLKLVLSGENTTDLWLRAGDVIEVPEKR